MTSSLWGSEFEVATPQKTKKILSKVKNPIKNPTISKRTTISKGLSIEQQIKAIEEEVYRILGKFKENIKVIRDYNEFVSYIDEAIKNGEIAIDTETNNSLQPVSCKLMGPCIYTPGQKWVYIPVNHINPQTKEKLPNQLTEEQIKEQFDRLSNTKIIMHNGKFDYEVIKCTCDCKLKVYWDTILGARLLNENEKADLKDQYISKIDSSLEKYNIEGLFKKLPYEIFPPELFALYAATDAYMTYQLYKYQEKEFAKEENKRLFKLFMEVEMPVLEVTAEMELTGICIDEERARRLSEKYHKLLVPIDQKIEEQLKEYDEAVAQWRKTKEANFHPRSEKPNKDGIYAEQKSKSEQLENPIKVSSPTQLAILIYDVLAHPVVDKKSPRGTGEEILKKLEYPFCKTILERRGLFKLISTYIDKIPTCVDPKDNRLHAHFNQIGADTGRFSSSDPNLQNIPSHNKEIRTLFAPKKGCVLVGSDFSQQEPRLLASYAKDNVMLEAYRNKKDLYATIASQIYHNKYEDNLQYFPDGSLNVEGGKRRSNCKAILLGLLYGKGVKSLAEDIKSSEKEAQQIMDTFFNEFNLSHKWMQETEENAKKFGFVEDMWGRRRRLPDIQLPRFEVKEIGKINTTNPMLFCDNIAETEGSQLIKKYKDLLSKTKGRNEIEDIKSKALKENISIRDNGAFIAQAQRQCVNARIQGGAATMSKIAMIKIYNDKRLKDLGFKLQLAIHDEVIGECPTENAEEASRLLCDIMAHSVEDTVVCPMKCDPTIEDFWYQTEYYSIIKEEYDDLCKKNNKERSFEILCKNHGESTEDELRKVVNE